MSALMTATRESAADLSRRRSERIRNRVLGVLTEAEWRTIEPYVEYRRLAVGDVLCASGVPLAWAYFPVTAAVGYVHMSQSGTQIETNVVGCDGMVGSAAITLGKQSINYPLVTQVAGTAFRMRADQFLVALSALPRLHREVYRQIGVLLTMGSQNAVCGSLHTLEQRCARRLLTMADYAGDSFPLTHELLAQLLGISRSAVSLTFAGLQSGNLVHYHRGSVEIVNRAGLEQRSCDCYSIVKSSGSLWNPPLLSYNQP